MLAINLQHSNGYDMRSRCTLISDIDVPTFVFLKRDGSTKEYTLPIKSLYSLYEECYDKLQDTNMQFF